MKKFVFVPFVLMIVLGACAPAIINNAPQVAQPTATPMPDANVAVIHGIQGGPTFTFLMDNIRFPRNEDENLFISPSGDYNGNGFRSTSFVLNDRPIEIKPSEFPNIKAIWVKSQNKFTLVDPKVHFERYEEYAPNIEIAAESGDWVIFPGMKDQVFLHMNNVILIKGRIFPWGIEEKYMQEGWFNGNLLDPKVLHQTKPSILLPPDRPTPTFIVR